MTNRHAYAPSQSILETPMFDIRKATCMELMDNSNFTPMSVSVLDIGVKQQLKFSSEFTPAQHNRKGSFNEYRAVELENEASIFAGQGFSVQALERLTAAIEIAPNNWARLPTLYSHRGAVLFEQNRYEAAIVDLTESLRRAPSRSHETVLLGRAYLKLGLYKKAEACFCEAMRLSALSCNTLSEAENSSVRSVCDTGIEHAQRVRKALSSAIKAFKHNLDTSRILSEAEIVLSISPRCTAAAFFRAQSLFKLKRYSHCIEYCEHSCMIPDTVQLPGISPCTPFPPKNEHFLKCALHMPENVGQVYVQALRSIGRSADARTVALQFANNFPEVSWCSDAVLAIDMLDKVSTALKVNMFKEVVSVSESALKLNETCAYAYGQLRYMRAVAFLALTRFDEAIIECDNALKIMPEFYTAILMKSKGLKCLNRNDEAISTISTYLSVVPNDEEAKAEMDKLLNENKQKKRNSVPATRPQEVHTHARTSMPNTRVPKSNTAQKDNTAQNAGKSFPKSSNSTSNKENSATARGVDTSNFYTILGVGLNAPPAAIKRAYRTLALQYHPDKNKLHGASDVFKLCTDAYKVLASPAGRREYDTKLINVAKNRPQTGLHRSKFYN